jgi:hypothetical protein
MVPPRVVVKDGMGGRRLARSFSRSAATERLVNAIFVVIMSELFQLRPRSTAFLISTWSRNSRRIVPISRSTNGWDQVLRPPQLGFDPFLFGDQLADAEQPWVHNITSLQGLWVRKSGYPTLCHGSLSGMRSNGLACGYVALEAEEGRGADRFLNRLPWPHRPLLQVSKAVSIA